MAFARTSRLADTDTCTMTKITIILMFSLLLVTLGNSLDGQVSHGGYPLMNTADFDASRVMYLLEPEDPLRVAGLNSAKYNSLTKALNYATERPVDLSPEVNGEWVEREGLHIWRAHLISPEAYSLGILFSEFSLAENARLFIYDPAGNHIRGAYTHENNKPFGTFYVGHVPGEEVILELQVQGPDREYGTLRVGSLSHAFLPVYAEKSIDGTGLGTSQDCELDINCTEGDEWEIVKHSVCHISTTSLLCTGALINNTAYDGKPYVLTAEHCINKTFYAENSVFYFNYENSDCGTLDARKNQSVSGSSLIATGDSLDFTLVRLSTRLPRDYNVYFAGWDARDMTHVSTVTLHHPNADAMKISFDLDATNNPTSLPGDLNDYIVASNYRVLEWDFGSTEGGSSGAPFFNSSKRIIGLLSGGLATCGDSIGYDTKKDRVIYSLRGNTNDYFSKVSYNWEYYADTKKQLMHWLDPVGTGQLSIGGLAQITLDVKDHMAGTSFLKVYPNPSRGEFMLELPSYSGKPVSVDIFDVTGKRIYTATSRSVHPVHVSLADQPAGIYLVRVTDGQQVLKGSVVIE
jgi:lysyl endopeptidase